MSKQSEAKEKQGYVPLRLEARYEIGAGWEIFADIPERISCVEYAMKPGWKRVLKTQGLIAYAPWVGAFTPKELEQVVGQVLTEMVKLWNEHHAQVAEALKENPRDY